MHTYAQTNIQLYNQMMEQGRPAGDLAMAQAAYGLACQRFAGLLRPNGKCFIAHLVGTASIAAAHGANRETIAAAILHAWISHGSHRVARLWPPRRLPWMH